VLVPVTLNDPEWQDGKVQTFWRISIIMHQLFDLERQNLVS